MPRFPVGNPIVYSSKARCWLVYWPEITSSVPTLFGFSGASLVVDEPGWVCLTVTGGAVRHLVDMFPPATLRQLQTSDPYRQGVINGAPLFPLEDLMSWRDPLRFSWRAHLAAAVACAADGAWASNVRSIPARQGYIMGCSSAASRATFAHMDRVSCFSDHCLCSIPPVCDDSSAFESCAWCTANEYSLRVCCAAAIPQRRPSAPRSDRRLFFMDLGCDWDPCNHDEFGPSSTYPPGVRTFDAHQALAYNFTCRATCATKLNFDVYRAVFAPVPGGPPHPHGFQSCPAAVTEIVCDYLGRRTLSILFSSLFSQTCVFHPSALDFQDAYKLGGRIRTTGRLRRIATMSHYYHVLTMWCLSHHARVACVTSLIYRCRHIVTDARNKLGVAPATIPSNESHSEVHSQQRELWALIYRAFHQPAVFLRNLYLDNMHDRALSSAVWSLVLWPIATAAVCGRNDSPLLLGLAGLHPPLPSSACCVISCCSSLYTPECDVWVHRVTGACGRVGQISRKRARVESFVSDPWSATPETTRSFRHLIPYHTDSDDSDVHPCSSPDSPRDGVADVWSPTSPSYGPPDDDDETEAAAGPTGDTTDDCEPEPHPADECDDDTVDDDAPFWTPTRPTM